MKRILRFILIALVSVSFCACSSGSKETKTAASAKNSPQKKEKKKKERPKYDNASIQAVEASSIQIESALNKADLGDLDAAISSLVSISEKHPKAFIAHYDLGLLYERKPDYDKARDAYEAALNAEPSFVLALIQLIRIDIRNGQTADAIQKANKWLTIHPDIFDYNYAKVEAMIADKQYDSAITMCRQLLKKDEANAKLRYYLASAEYERKRYRLAEFIVGESLSINPDDPDALFLRARIHDALSKEDVALIPGIAATLDEVLERNPDHIEALWMRGNIYYNASNYQKAEEFYRRILKLSPNLAGAHINLGNTLKTVNRGPEAEKILLRAKELEPNNGLVLFSLGTLYLNFELISLPQKTMDRLKLAKQYFEDAKNNWTSKDDIALAKGYIRTTDDAIETQQAMLDAEALFAAVPEDEAAGGTDSAGSSDIDTGAGGADSAGNDSGNKSFRIDDTEAAGSSIMRVD